MLFSLPIARPNPVHPTRTKISDYWLQESFSDPPPTPHILQQRDEKQRAGMQMPTQHPLWREQCPQVGPRLALAQGREVAVRLCQLSAGTPKGWTLI